MRKMLQTMKTLLEEGQDLVLVTVIASSGATPRGAGARMLVGKNGRICGTIGGGAVEYSSEQIALQVLQEKSSRGQDFSLTRDDVQNLGMICGGACDVYFHYIPEGDTCICDLVQKAESFFEENRDLWMVSDIGDGGKLSLADKKDTTLAKYLTRHPCRVQENGKNLYVEQINAAGMVYIFGGGHVAQELVPVLSHVGFRCVVMDDREEFTGKELFPSAERIVRGDFTRIEDVITITENDYVCVMTRGHGYDTVVQAQVLKKHPCYCGVIGSKFKAAGVRQTLKEVYGLQDRELDQVTTPIGLDIKGETPAEIAISIAAQMILVRAERSGL